MRFISQVSEFPSNWRRFFKHFLLFVVRLVNALDNNAVKHLADVLKVNTTLTILDLDCEYLFFQNIIYCDCVCRHIDNRFGDDGVIAIAEALKVNSTLVDMGLAGANIIFWLFFIHLSRICEQEL